MKNKSILLTSLGVSFVALMSGVHAQVDWQQHTAKAQDVAVSHGGDQWFIGQDGKAYRKDGDLWKNIGGRSDFVRIDAGDAGVAAVTDNGSVYIKGHDSGWISTGIKADDVGLGDGQVWLAGARNSSGGRVTLYGAFDTDKKITWEPVKGTLERLDVDPQGRPWGIDNSGGVFVYANGAWIADEKAPKASDIGVGGDGSIYIVGADYNEALGGGRVYLRDANNGEWNAVPGRLSAISVTPEGKAFGANSLSWLMAGMANGSSSPGDNGAGSLPNDNVFSVTGDTTLADILGSVVPGADKVKLSRVEVTENMIAGVAELNGSEVRAMLYQPDPKDAVFIAGLEHDAVDLGTYVPKIRNTSLGSFGLMNAVFYMQDENAQAIEYTSFDDMPTQLSRLIAKQKDYQSLFPLVIHPGVTVIGTYSPENKNAKAVMAAYGMKEAGYVIKGHFKLSQLKNLSFNTPSFEMGGSAPKSKKEACESSSSAGLSGLDLSFPIPDFEPPYAQGAIDFRNTVFSLKEMNGQIEPSIVSAMTMKLPEEAIGITNIPMAGKLAVRSDLNVLCSGLNSETSGIVTMAAATVYNAETVKDVAIEALSRITDEGAESPDGEGLGWKNAFGLPFLTIRQYALSGVFEQKEVGGVLKRTLSSAAWSDSIVDRAHIDVFSTAEYEIKADHLEVTDWSFELDGPVAMNDLPGLKDMPKIDEFVLRDIYLTPSEMTGTMEWGAKGLSADAYLSREAQDDGTHEYSVFSRFNKLSLGALSDKFPPLVRDVSFAPAVIGWGNKDLHTVKVADVAEDLKPLFEGLLDDDDTLTIAKGITLAGAANPKEFFVKPLDTVLDVIEVGNALTVVSALEADAAGDFSGALRASLNTLKVKEIPETLLSFENATLSLSNIDGRSFEISSDAKVSIPQKTAPIDMSGTLRYEAKSEVSDQLDIALSSSHLWNNPMNIPDLQISNLGFEASLAQKNKILSQSMALNGQGVLRGQAGQIEVAMSFDDGLFDDGVVIFKSSAKDGFDVADFLSLPEGAGDIANAHITTLMLSQNAVAADVSFNLNDMAFDGKGAVITDGDHAAFFFRQDKQIDLGKMVDDIPSPFRDISLPKGVLIVSTKKVQSFDAGDIPDAIYDDVLAGLVEDEKAYSLFVDEGLSFMTKMSPSAFPEPIPSMLKTPFGVTEETYFAGSVGGIFGGDPSFGFYTVLKNVTPSFPSFVGEFIEFKNADLRVFVRSQTGAAATVEVGVAADAKVKPRRLDDPTVVQPLDAIFSLTYAGNAASTSVTASADVIGQWDSPMGLDGYRFQNPSFTFGIEEKGTTVGVHTDRADFSQGGTNKAFVFDLDTTWAGAVPTDFSVQFAKTKDIDELVLTPVDLARVQKSVFDLVFRSGSKIKDGTLAALKHVPTYGDPALSLLKGQAPDMVNRFTSLIENANDGMFSLVEQSPLSMIGVKNPEVYFGTPGSTPPKNPDIDRPPLGLGLHVEGQFLVDFDVLKADLASGIYKVNLRDGYFVNGRVTPPAPFAANSISVSGNMPFLGGAQYLRFSGNLEIPGATFAGIGLGLNGTFDMTRGSIVKPQASVYADVSIGGVLNRKGNMTLNGTSLSFNSPGGCTDIPPLDIRGDISLSGFTTQSMTSAFIDSFELTVPDPVACAGDLFEKFQDIAEGVKDVVSDPLGSGEELGKNVGDLVTNPGETLKKAQNLAKAPQDTAEALAGAGISLVRMGVEKIPVLGPGAGQAIGQAFNEANKLKDAAVNAVTNNAVTNFVGSVISDGYDAVTGVFKTSERTWYSINALRCIAGERYWNQMFRQCFEHGAVVLFDNSTRQGDGLGECIATAHIPNLRSILGFETPAVFSKGALRVGACKGNGFNQFHLDSVTDQIRAVKKVYNGKRGDFLGPDEDVCLTRRLENMQGGLKKGDVYVHRCAVGALNQEWSYTADMKLKNGDMCITRSPENALIMGGCENATQWLGTSVVPDWNMAKGVPIRGQITHVQSGRCLNWWDGGPHRLIKCGDAPGLDRDLRTHARLRVLDENNTISIMGSAYWNTHVYPCVGLTGPDSDAVMNRHCWPAYVYEEAKWKVWPIINSKIDKTGQIPLIDVLTKYEYVFENLQNGKCLTASMTAEQVKDEGNRPWVNAVEACADWWGNAKAGVRFIGYTADSVAQNVIDTAVEKARRAWERSRYKLLPIIQEWQKYRIRSENARIEEVRKMAGAVSADHRAVQQRRNSPGNCAHGEFWNQSLKSCSREARMLLKYHNAQGQYQGCLQEDRVGYYGARLIPECNVNQQYSAVLDSFAFFFDDKGRIVKKSSEYWANIQAGGTDEKGQVLYYDVGDIEVSGDDKCLSINPGVNKLDGLRPLDFMTCSEHSITWSYSPRGELVSSDGKCARNHKYIKKLYNRDNVRKIDKIIAQDVGLKQKYADLEARKSRRYRDRDAFIRGSGQSMKALMDSGALAAEWDRLTVVHGIDALSREISQYKSALDLDLRKKYPVYTDQPAENLVLDDCRKDPMDFGKYRWIPTIGYNFTREQGLPDTARIQLASQNGLCLSADMFNHGTVSYAPCDDDNKDQYFAFGGTDKTRFLISPRNSKTCLYDAGQLAISHRACNGSGAEMFVQIDAGNGDIKLQNALSGLCLGEADGAVKQVSCSNALTFELDIVSDIASISFAQMGLLQANEARTAAAQALWDKAEKRATYMYMGAFLKSGDSLLQLGEDDKAIMKAPQEFVTLEKVISHVFENELHYIPAVSVAKTQMLLLPGFEDGANHVTFAHAKPVEFLNGTASRDYTSDPYVANYPDWFVWAHRQKVMRIMDDGSVKFDYIDESDAFRKSASFKMISESGAGENHYSFESVSMPGHYLRNQNGILSIGTGKDIFVLESAAQYLKSENINLVAFTPPYREARPPYTGWTFPDTPDSILNKH